MSLDLHRVASRVRLMVGRALLRFVNDAASLQSVQVEVREGEVRENVERFQQYGYSSVPHEGAEGVALAVGGSTDHIVIVCMDDRRYRLKGLERGEVAIYTDEGDTIILKRDREIEITAGARVTINAPLVHMTGDLQVDGTATADVDVIGGGKSLKDHQHQAQGANAITTSPI